MSDPFIVDGGEMGARLRAHAWSATPLGPLGDWPRLLRTLAGVMVGSHQPMVIVWGPERTLLYNDAYAAILGRKHPDALGRDLLAVWSEARDELSPLVERAYAGESFHMEDITLVLERDGYPEELHFSFSFTPVRDPAGAVSGFFCPCTETTRHIVAERRLRESEAENRGVLEGMAEAFILLDGNFHIRRVNAEALRIDGRERDAILGRHLLEVWPEAEHLPTWPLFQRAMTNRTPEALTYRHRSEVHDVWLDVRAYVSGDGLAVFYRDVTPAKRDEVALRESEERLRLVVDGATDYAILTTDPERRITSWSAGAERVFGYAAAEAIGRSADTIFTPEDRAEGRPDQEAALARDQGCANDERWHVRADGGRVFMNGAMRPLPRDAQGREQGFIKIARDETARRAAEQEIASNRERLQTALETGLVGFFEWDVALDRIVADRRWAAFYGIDPAAAAAGVPLAGIAGVMHPDDRAAVFAAVEAALTSANDYAQEFRLLRADGGSGWLLVRGHCVEQGHGRGLRYVGVAIDITASKAAEAKARASEERLALTLSNAQIIGTWDWDVPNDRVYADERFARLYAVEPAVAAAGAPISAFLGSTHPDDAARLETQIRHALRTGEPFVAEYRLTRRDAEVRHVLARGRCAFDDADAPTRFSGVSVDITDQRRVEQALRELNDTLEQRVAERTRERDLIWRASRDLYVVCSFDGVYRSANPAWRDLGYEPEALVGARFEALIHPDDVPAVRSRFAALVGGDPDAGMDSRIRAADGTYRWVAWTAVVAGEDIYAAGRDVTERRALEEQLRQSQKMDAIGQLTGGIAHDFNNLLTGIIGALDIVRRRIDGGRLDDVARFMDAASTSAQRAAALTHRLLAFARRQPLDAKPSDVNHLIAGMEDLLNRTLGEQIELATVLEAGLWPAMTDANQLENAILNLAINARDAMVGGGRLTVETANARLHAPYTLVNRDVTPGDYVVVSVSDTGAGMTSDVVDKAFEPFFTTKPSGQGTGLGLSMIYGFVKQSGGHAKIYSEVGRGTTVKLYLPRAVSTRVEAFGRENAAPRGRGETVLVVEDDSTVRLLVAEVLEELGYRHLDARDAPTALVHLESRQRIDLMISDVGLPGMSGRELAEVARQTRPHLKILFVTGYAENAAVRGGFLAPGMEMLTKPFDLEALGTKIRQIIEGPSGTI